MDSNGINETTNERAEADGSDEIARLQAIIERAQRHYSDLLLAGAGGDVHVTIMAMAEVLSEA